MTEILESCEGFDWDDANSDKNWLKHKVSKTECEQVFLNSPLIITDDKRHSASERRCLYFFLIISIRFPSSFHR